MTTPRPLFSRPDAFARKGLAALPGILDRIMPLNGSHRRDLPLACRELSAALTTDRPALSRPYWASPRLTSAYLRYFLPWNLVRLTTLLPGLDLGGTDEIPDKPLMLDLGSGPLTFPLALWLSRPDFRSLPLTVIASDVSPHILDVGRRLLEGLREDLDPSCPWTIRTMRASFSAVPGRTHGRPWLLTMGNVLNEMEDRDGQRHPGRASLAECLTGFLADAAALLLPGGRLLAVEPGTRQGGRLIAGLRRIALSSEPFGPERFGEEDWSDENAESEKEEDRNPADTPAFPESSPPPFQPLSPCPHAGPCPMLARKSTAWCHVNAPAPDAPRALRELSRQAGLDKDSVSLSFLLLRRMPDDAPDPEDSAGRRETLRKGAPGPLTARVVSDPFVLPGWPGRARYACAAPGLVLIPDSAFLPAGCLCEVRSTPRRDAKSGAIIAPRAGKEPAGPTESTGTGRSASPRIPRAKNNLPKNRRSDLVAPTGFPSPRRRETPEKQAGKTGEKRSGRRPKPARRPEDHTES